jgi:hypothetical protein
MIPSRAAALLLLIRQKPVGGVIVPGNVLVTETGDPLVTDTGDVLVASIRLPREAAQAQPAEAPAEAEPPRKNKRGRR